MKNLHNTPKKIKIYCLAIGILAFFITLFCGCLLEMNKMKEEKMRAAFSAGILVFPNFSGISLKKDGSWMMQSLRFCRK